MIKTPSVVLDGTGYIETSSKITNTDKIIGWCEHVPNCCLRRWIGVFWEWIDFVSLRLCPFFSTVCIFPILFHTCDKIRSQYKFARDGAPWDFNLRDVFRWCTLTETTAKEKGYSNLNHIETTEATNAMEIEEGEESEGTATGTALDMVKDVERWSWALRNVDIIYMQRLRHFEDRTQVALLCQEIFETNLYYVNHFPLVDISETVISIGNASLLRTTDNNTMNTMNTSNTADSSVSTLPFGLSRPLSHMMTCVARNWPCLPRYIRN